MKIANFVVYDITTGRIIRTGTCPRELIPLQVTSENEWVMEGTANAATQKIEGTSVVEKSMAEKDEELYTQRVKKFPTHLDVSLPDEELNKQISDYFLGRVDVAQWRLDNYAYLRRRAYPPVTEYIDSQVKMAMSGPEVAEGQKQLATYLAACRAVKERFPSR